MKEEINKKSTGKIKEKLLQFWTNEVKREEEKSRRILDTKKAWLDEYERNYGKQPVKRKQQNRQGQPRQRRTAPPMNTGVGQSTPQINTRPPQQQTRSYADAVRSEAPIRRQGPLRRQRGNFQRGGNFTQGPRRRIRRPFNRRDQFQEIQPPTNEEYQNTGNRRNFLGGGPQHKKRKKVLRYTYM